MEDSGCAFELHEKEGNKNMSTLSILQNLPDSPNLLLQYFQPTGIRDNFLCVLDCNIVPIESALADDNGAYLVKSSNKKIYFLERNLDGKISDVHEAHRNTEGSIHIKSRISAQTGTRKPTYIRKIVDPNCVYEVKRMYRTNKANSWLKHTLISVDGCPYYMTAYSVDEKIKKEFFSPRHGNSSNASVPSYSRADPLIMEEVRTQIRSGKSNDQIRSSLLQEENLFVPQLKQIENTRAASNTKSDEANHSELFKIITAMRENYDEKFIQFVPTTDNQYMCIMFLKQTIDDVVRFCCNRNSVFRIDTTFELFDKLWLTDTSYTNFSLVVEGTNRHPEFPGPSMLHFRKDKLTFRLFAGILIGLKPELLDVEFIGTDMDLAISNGFGEVMRNATKLTCIQHVKERDAHQLRSMRASIKHIEKILCDIYGSCQNGILQCGLDSADDDDDFRVKLQSLESSWEECVPGFHKWFTEKRTKVFLDTVLNRRKDRHSQDEKFYTNRLEILHRLQKKHFNENGSRKNIIENIHLLKEWNQKFYTECEQAIQGRGKYRLANDYEHFLVLPQRWVKLSTQQKARHLNNFFSYEVGVDITYKKPKIAGKKPSKQVRRDTDVHMVSSRFDEDNLSRPDSEKISPLKLRKVNDMYVPTQSTSHIDTFDPFRDSSTDFKLVHRADTKSWPRQVIRCEMCRQSFSLSDVICVKTSGVRKYKDNSGNEKTYVGNIYIHFLKKCLDLHTNDFRFQSIRVVSLTNELLQPHEISKLKKLNLTFEN